LDEYVPDRKSPAELGSFSIGSKEACKSPNGINTGTFDGIISEKGKSVVDEPNV
jgi:hypothetical protein